MTQQDDGALEEAFEEYSRGVDTGSAFAAGFRAGLSRGRSWREGKYIDVIFDGGPSHESGCFVEVENEQGESIRFGEWIERPDGYWALRFPLAGERVLPDGLPCPNCRAGSREIVGVQPMKVVPEGFFIKREEPEK